MGFETANVHLGSKAAVAAILQDLDQRPARWLQKAAKAMAEATHEDFDTWEKG